MKIRSIRKVSNELYLITYHRWLLGDVERYVIHERTEIPVEDPLALIDKKEMCDFFHYRDTGDYIGSEDSVLKWMVRNDVEFFDNIKTRQLYVEPVTKEMVDKNGNLIGNIPNIPNIPPIPPRTGYQPLPKSETKPEPPAKPPRKV